ncbi:MAG: hypothetical protein H6686_02235 [Fibrobacteria bacterium]|nr:hypothetical protein [Fibrobacteria bacterium]
MKARPRILSLLPPLLALGCQAERSAGTTTETENSIASRSFAIDSLLPSGAGTLFEPVVATLRLDSNAFDFHGSRPDGRDLEVVRESGDAIPFELVFWDPTTSQGRLKVRVDPWIRAPGSRLVLRSGATPADRSSSSRVWAGIPLDRRQRWNSVLVDDFESGNLLRNCLPDSSFWFLGGLLPASGPASSSPGRPGTGLRLTCGPGQCAGSPSILAATLVAGTPRSFRSLDSIELWARGNGRVWVALEYLDSVQMGRMQRGQIDSIRAGRVWVSRTLDTAWSRVSIPPSAFLAASGADGNTDWEILRDSVNYLTFLLDGGSELWLDDIRFHGLLATDLE